MVEPLFWTRCPERFQVDDYPAYWGCRCSEAHEDGMVGWPQPCPDCDGKGERRIPQHGEGVGVTAQTVVVACGCDGGRVWPEGWQVKHPFNSEDDWLMYPLEEP